MDCLAKRGLGIERKIKLPNLDEILDNAPPEVDYEENKKDIPGIRLSGFTLANEAIKMNYSEKGFGGPHTIDVWFMQITPIVAINGYLSWAPPCEIEAISLDLAVILTDGKKIIDDGHVQRGYTLPCIERGEDLWFVTADSLLNKATRKYDIIKHLLRYYSLTHKEDLTFLFIR